MSRSARIQDALLAVAVLASRAPFLGAGYGTDTDAWKVARAAHAIARTGRYETSRLPGYPVQELVSAMLVRGGPLWLNGASALASAACAVLLSRWFRGLGGRRSWLMGLAFAFVPTVYIGSVSAMDYLWALAFILGAFAAAGASRSVLAGVLLGLATGCRITSVCFALPVGLVLIERRPAGTWRALAALGASMAAVAAICYVPVVLRYGPGFLSYYEPYGGPERSVFAFLTGILVPGRSPIPLPLVFGQGTVLVWGLLGCAVVSVFGALSLWPSWSRPRAAVQTTRGTRWAWIISVAMMLVLYLRLPHDEAYLIPAVPFVLMLLATRLRPALLETALALLLVAPFLVSVDLEPPKKGLTPDVHSPVTVRVHRVGAEQVVLDVLRGPVIEDWDKRRRMVEVLDRTLSIWPSLGAHARVMVGNLDIAMSERVRVGDAGPRYYDVMTRVEFDTAIAAGDTVYVLPGANERATRAVGYDPVSLGARPLFGE